MRATCALCGEESNECVEIQIEGREGLHPVCQCIVGRRVLVDIADIKPLWN